MELDVSDRVRRNYSKDLKLEAVNLLVTRCVSVARTCRDLDIAENVMRRWIREFRSSDGQAFPGPGVLELSNSRVLVVVAKTDDVGFQNEPSCD